MNRVTVGIKVFCANTSCWNFLTHGEGRFIGEDGGMGGRWQCPKCHKWTARQPAA